MYSGVLACTMYCHDDPQSAHSYYCWSVCMIVLSSVELYGLYWWANAWQYNQRHRKTHPVRGGSHSHPTCWHIGSNPGGSSGRPVLCQLSQPNSLFPLVLAWLTNAMVFPLWFSLPVHVMFSRKWKLADMCDASVVHIFVQKSIIHFDAWFWITILDYRVFAIMDCM